MASIQQISGRGIPLTGNDIDTDRIIPARFLRCVTFDGLGEHVFCDDRAQLAAKSIVHPFDDPRFAGARILIVGGNFGCGSSREHAPQAIARWGISAIVGVSFSEIFFGNTVAMGLPCLQISASQVEALQNLVRSQPFTTVTVDVAGPTVSWTGSAPVAATMPEGSRQAFLSGHWDATSELIEGLPQVRRTAEALPYVRGFA